MRITFVAMLVLASCGGPTPLKAPFSGLQAGVCADDTDCDIGKCPNACNQGQPYCAYPPVYARADILRKCPCVETPSADKCAAPAADACGPQPGCAGPFDVDQVRARCISGMCAARFLDGGTVP